MSLKHQRMAPHDTLQVVVVDDGSSDDTQVTTDELGHELDLIYHFEPRGSRSGRSRARNIGVELASGDLIVMIDPDHVFPPGLIAEHVRYHEYSGALMVVGPRGKLAAGAVDIDELTRQLSWTALPQIDGGLAEDSRWGILSRLSHNLNTVATCWSMAYTCNASVRRRHLLAAGGFDESFTGWGLEDTELAYRLRQRDVAFAFNPDAAVYTWDGGLIDAAQYQQWRANLSYFCEKHPGLDVAAQWMFDDAFNPAATSGDWVRTCLQFEHVARAVVGRLPYNAGYRLAEVTDRNAYAFVSALPEVAADGNLIVVDVAGRPELSALVQSHRAGHELLYFCRTDRRHLAGLLERYPITSRWIR
ncbi:glycosyltransferase [Dactylosporangium sp. NPDC049525]|uniref:glycosyltransferase family 2 protein n=1 Tax=Dactylosporangium sp. NPDC049525 TaxID=3154730 RepID=UPI003449F5FD